MNICIPPATCIDLRAQDSNEYNSISEETLQAFLTQCSMDCVPKIDTPCLLLPRKNVEAQPGDAFEYLLLFFQL